MILLFKTFFLLCSFSSKDVINNRKKFRLNFFNINIKIDIRR